jgi:hypothetical protein
MQNDNDQTDDTTDREPLARRNLLRLGGVAAAGAAAGAIAAAVNAAPAAAAAGDPMIVGDPNDAGAGTTELTSTGTSTLDLENSGTGRALLARETNAASGSSVIDAFTAGTGRVITAHIDNVSSTQSAIVAWTAGTGPAISALSLDVNGPAISGETETESPGVLGTARANATAPGVQGTSLGTAAGVRAVGRFIPASPGVGSGYAAALDVRGRAAFDRSGLLTIPAGATNAFSGLVAGGVFSSSRVLATIQENKGTATVRAAVPITAGPNKGRIQIILTGAVPASPAGGLKVAWFVFG